MNVLVRRALKRAEKQLESALEPGERILDFDIGVSGSGAPVHCVATTHALYAVGRGGAALRLPYRTFTSLQGDARFMAITTSTGSEYAFAFRSPRRGFSDAVVQHAQATLRAQAQRRRAEGRIYEVRWDEESGVRFITDEEGQEVARPFGPQPGNELMAAMILEQAWGELQASRGEEPKLQYASPRPAWMPDFTWDPPLPTRAGAAG